nr:type II toxin-antitoxin system VapB family antitoxin [Microbacterium bovistercoris]
MSVTQIDLDDDALREVLRRSGLTTKKDAVNEALRDYAAKLRRAAEFDGYIRRSSEWDYEAWKEMRAADRAVEA